MPHIDYYFSTISPYTYLAGTRMEAVAAKHGATISYKPLDIIALFGRTGGVKPAERHESRKAMRLQELRRQAAKAFPHLKATNQIEWLGHRPAPSDSLPLIGQVGDSRVFTAFGHHHIGLTGGPKTGRLVAGLITGEQVNTDLTLYHPLRFS